MNRRLLPLFSTAFGLSALLLALPAGVRADCPPDAQFCGEVQVGPASARAVIRGPVVVAQAPVVVDAPAPPPARVVIRHPRPAPRRVVVHRAPARIIVRHPAPRVVYAPEPAPVYAQPAPVYAPQPAPAPPAPARERFRRVGLFASGSAILGEEISMGGIAGGLVIRPARHFGIRVGVGAYGGTDYAGASRTEVPFSNDFLVYFNPSRRFQIYYLAGFHLSRAVTTQDVGYIGTEERRFDYIGGQTGLGAELRLGRAFALTFDARAFLREQVRAGVVEFTERRSDGSIRTTNTSAGAMLSFGGALYF